LRFQIDLERIAFHLSPALPRREYCKTKERFANAEPVPASLARSCPRSFDFVRGAHFSQDDTQWHKTPLGSYAKASRGGELRKAAIFFAGCLELTSPESSESQRTQHPAKNWSVVRPVR